MSEHDLFRLNLCCEELMTNIAQHSHGHVVHHSFDVHIYSDDKGTCVALKDGGKPFNPLSRKEEGGRRKENTLTAESSSDLSSDLSSEHISFLLPPSSFLEKNISKEGGEGLGLCLINNLVENISYKYMYGLNIVLIKI